jgi:hypothetical protein
LTNGSIAFNLVEIFFLIIPFEWWLPSQEYAKLNDIVMGIIYSPLLLVIGFLEVREARRIRSNRRRGEEDDDDVEEWEHTAVLVDFEIDDTWKQTVREITPNVHVDQSSLEIAQLREQVQTLTELVRQLADERLATSFGAGESSSNAAD